MNMLLMHGHHEAELSEHQILQAVDRAIVAKCLYCLVAEQALAVIFFSMETYVHQ